MAMDGDVNLMKAAIVASTAVTTVSPSYAEEIQTEYYGYRLDSVLRMNSYKLHGILNGIDMDAFNPQTDTKIFKQYGPKTPEDKLVNKTELLKLCGLEGDADARRSSASSPASSTRRASTSWKPFCRISFRTMYALSCSAPATGSMSRCSSRQSAAGRTRSPRPSCFRAIWPTASMRARICS